MAKQKDPKYLDDAFEQVCAELLATFLKKHKDYGKGNIISIKELGITFRVSEKAERLKNLLMSSNTPENESIDDSWTDIGVYAVIGILFRRGWFEKLEVHPDKK
ncbi:MAG: hypothetical protein BroJett025_03620 [Patescibacteria group bacterium]|nr:MAG: hypothetical protein BroJett025_03620 [Patescibacteria group bacterium]